MKTISRLMLILGCLVLFVGCTGEEEQKAGEPAEPSAKMTAETPAKEGSEEPRPEATQKEEVAGTSREEPADEPAIQDVRSEVRELEETQKEEPAGSSEKPVSEEIQEIEQPDVKVYEAVNGNVTFDHYMHSAMISCTNCHESMPPQKIAIDKDKAHKMCKGCHQEEGAGPTACNDCHKKE